MNDLIQTDKNGPLAYLTINQPQRRNAMSYAMWCDLGSVLRALAEDNNVRVLIIRGAGEQAFCAGNDIAEFSQWRTDEKRLAQYHGVADGALQALHDAPFPVIAKIRGACVGGGCELALMCDFRYAAENAKFAITPAKLGLGYSFGDVQRVVAVLGARTARLLLLSGRLFSAGQAVAMGLADAVFSNTDLDAGVEALALELAGNAPLTLRALKAALNEAQRPRGEQHLDRVQELVDRCHGSDDYQEGQAAFAAKRRPDFKGR